MSEILNDENFEKEIKCTNKLVLVDFFATWCEPCSMLAPILEKVVESLKDKVVLMKASLDDVPKIAEQFGVEKIPTVILFKNGVAISGFVGLAPESSIKEWIMTGEFEDYAKTNGFQLNPDKKTVDRVIKGLLANEQKFGSQYCPCRRVTGDKEEDAKKICPCVWGKAEIEKDGHCLCNLYVK